MTLIFKLVPQANGRLPKLFGEMILILIFAKALARYGLIEYRIHFALSLFYNSCNRQWKKSLINRRRGCTIDRTSYVMNKDTEARSECRVESSDCVAAAADKFSEKNVVCSLYD
ncbi:hypothetical protein LguiA_026437 [Lonicera macranthoides]